MGAAVRGEKVENKVTINKKASM
jgi:hypothetical protein